ncbi:MAG: hypothetical protein ACSHXB_11840 [Sulfitobacter sp.]
MISRTLHAVALVLLSSPALASPTVYDCNITEKHRKLNWITDKMAFVIGGNGQVKVFDGVISHYEKKPMVANVVRLNEKSVKVRWKIRGTLSKTNQRTTSMNYEATINRKTNRVAVFAKPANFPNRFRGKGTCKVRTDGRVPVIRK